MFELIPAVDIQRGRAVRLYEGDPQRETVYFDDPLAAARHWVGLGAQRLHIVDLDAALGTGDNGEVIGRIAQLPGVRLQLGGGIRTLEAARERLELVDRVILGTAAALRPELIDALLAEAGPERVIVSIDARRGLVAVRGWTETSSLTAVDLATRVADQGVRSVIFTDVSRDGTLQGVDADPVRAVRDAFPFELVAGGGVASTGDLALYERLGLDGAVVGRALYEGRVEYPYRAGESA